VKILVEQLGATRLVVDSLPGFGFRVTDLNTLREIFLEVGLLLKDVGCTTLMTTEIVEGSGLISRYGIEEFLATGVMVLSLVRQSSPIRKLFVRKMRGTSHSLNDYAFVIGPDGIAIKGPVGVRSASHGRRRLHSSSGRKRRSRR
jgi:circadian clock protein KaiC